MSYINTFIQVAADCPVTSSIVPVTQKENKPLHIIAYETSMLKSLLTP